MGVSQRELVARDGTRIGYQVRADGDRPWIVFANGAGASHLAFGPLIEQLPEYNVLVWDYRGLFTSDRPGDTSADTIAHQVSDLRELLAAEGVGDFAIAGYSMGVQVALEVVRIMPSRVRGVFLMNGTFGKLFRTVMGNPAMGAVIPLVLNALDANARIANFFTRRVLRRRLAVKAMQLVGALSPDVDVALMHAVLANFGTIDWKVYARVLRRLDEHDASEVLATLDVPVAIVAGSRDPITPVATAVHLHHQIRGSRLAIVPGGTHYTPIEYPAVVGAEMRAWLDRVDAIGVAS